MYTAKESPFDIYGAVNHLHVFCGLSIDVTLIDLNVYSGLSIDINHAD